MRNRKVMLVSPSGFFIFETTGQIAMKCGTEDLH